MNDDVTTLEKHRSEADRLPFAFDTDFRIVAEDAPVMLWLTNADGKVVFTNSKWMKFVGTPAGERVGGDAWIKALHPDDLDPCMRIFDEAFRVHKAFEMEYRQKFAGFIESSTDITDRKNHENQLRLFQLELTQHNREMQLINELNSYLQVCRSLEEGARSGIGS